MVQESFKIFVASSTSGLPIARALQTVIERTVLNDGINARDVCDFHLWEFAFPPGETPLQTLLRLTREMDFAVFIFHPSDEALISGKWVSLVRDNVIFEYGLFMGQLGPQRAFVLRPRNHETLARLTDVEGLTHLMYDEASEPNPDYRRRVVEAADVICSRIVALGADQDRKLLYQKSRYLQYLLRTGLTHIYEQRKMALGKMIADIEEARDHIRLYARVYVSELIRDEQRLGPALLEAARRRAEQGQDGPLKVDYVSTDPDDRPLVQQLYRIEDGQARRWQTLEEYEHHVRGWALDELWESIERRCKTRRGGEGEVPEGSLLLQRRYFKDFLTPYSMLAIDGRVLYVGFYTFNQGKKYGSHSPTVRLSAEGDNPTWFRLFLEEADHMARHHIGEPVKEYSL